MKKIEWNEMGKAKRNRRVAELCGWHDSPDKDTCPRGAAPEFATRLGVCAKMEIDKDKK